MINQRHADRSFGKFYEGKKILVTGHTGFKGAWLSLWLTELGAEVTGMSLPPEITPNLFRSLRIEKRIRSYEKDIRNFAAVKKIIKKEKPEIIFHLAAQALVRASYLKPLETLQTNILGTAHLLEAIRQESKNVRVCQVVTSDKCYQNKESDYRYVESDPMGGHDPYSASKGAAELVVSSYRSSFFPAEDFKKHGVSLSSARAGNVIGGGDWSEDRIVPDCVRALSQGKPVLVRNPLAVRPWQYVLDALSGYLLLAKLQYAGDSITADAWNFGSSETDILSVSDLTARAIHAWGNGEWKSGSLNNFSGDLKLHEAKLLMLDSTKAREVLGWRPVFSAGEAIEETMGWYRGFYNDRSFDAARISAAMIRSYSQKANDRDLVRAESFAPSPANVQK